MKAEIILGEYGSGGGIDITQEPSLVGTANTYSTNTQTISGLTVGKKYIAIVSTFYSSGSADFGITSGGTIIWNKASWVATVGSAYMRNRTVCFEATATSAVFKFGTGSVNGNVVCLDYDVTA